LESCDQEYPLVRISPILSNGEIYQWNFGNDSTYIGEFPPNFRYQKAGTYTIKVKGINQFCEKEFSKTIKVNRNDIDFAKKVTIMPQKPVICVGATVPLQVTGGVKYLWTPATGLSNPNIANPIAKPLVTTRYNVRISNENGCYVDSTMLIVVAEEVKADFELQISSECGKNGAITFINKSTGTGEYKWTLGNGVEIREQNPKEYGFEKSGEYEIILEVFNGVCRKTKSQKVKIETVKPANVITPNGDGKNDRFVLDMLEQGWKLEIYDRYGNVKFKTDNYQNEWGGDVENGTYYYLLTSPSAKTCKGWIQVLKGE
jgi:gliding motility-associated-like protein